MTKNYVGAIVSPGCVYESLLDNLLPGANLGVVSTICDFPKCSGAIRSLGFELKDVVTVMSPNAMRLISLFIKPMPHSYVESAITTGLAGYNIDGVRIPTDWRKERSESWLNSGKGKGRPWHGTNYREQRSVAERVHSGGRWPTNLILANKNIGESSRFFIQTDSIMGAVMKIKALFEQPEGEVFYDVEESLIAVD